jgi:hypothetical protein
MNTHKNTPLCNVLASHRSACARTQVQVTAWSLCATIGIRIAAGGPPLSGVDVVDRVGLHPVSALFPTPIISEPYIGLSSQFNRYANIQVSNIITNTYPALKRFAGIRSRCSPWSREALTCTCVHASERSVCVGGVYNGGRGYLPAGALPWQ